MNAETVTTKIATNAVTNALQWGRVLMNAETCVDFDGVLHQYVTLQWGRVLMNAETKQLGTATR